MSRPRRLRNEKRAIGTRMSRVLVLGMGLGTSLNEAQLNATHFFLEISEREVGGGGGYQSHFPAHILPSAQIPLPQAEFRKIPVLCIPALFSSDP